MMVDPERVIFDISSDEEVGFVKSKGGGGSGSGGSDDYDWITELLGEGDERSKDDSDDVVVVREVITNPKQNLKSLPKPAVNNDDDDDDCVVLEEDPDKPVQVENDRADDDSDDLLVVGQKGQELFLCLQTRKTAYVGRERKMGSLQSNHATSFCSIQKMQHQFGLGKAMPLTKFRSSLG